MPLNPEELAKTENEHHARQLEQSMVIMATVMLRKFGRRRILISQDDIREAIAQGVVSVRNPPDDADAIVYELPPKKKARS